MDINSPETIQIFAMVDEDGREFDFMLMFTFEWNENVYLALLPLIEEHETEEFEILIARLEEDGDNFYISQIDDEQEWHNVVAVCEEIMAEDID